MDLITEVLSQKPRSRKKERILKLTAIFFILVVIPFMVHALFEIPETLEIFKPSEIILGAHRGNSVDYMENTLPAFQSALKKEKYKFIEFDVQYTKDKQPVVHHDESLIRIQKKFDYLEDLTYEELLEVSDYHIPTYKEVMDLLAGKKPLNIEIKSQGNSEDDIKLTDYVISDCTEREILNTTIISSISSDVINYLKDNYPEMKTGKIYYVYAGSFIDSEALISRVFEEADELETDYLMIYGANLKHFGTLWREIWHRERTNQRKIFLAYWYFTDEMYLVHKVNQSNYYEDPLTRRMIMNESIIVPPETIGAWWT